MDETAHGRMKRLSPEFYRGLSFVHWSMTIENRRTGWLTPEFHIRFRETQLHALCRYRLVCLVYCLMPDHLHVLWAGLAEDSDQDRAASFLRKYVNRLLAGSGAPEEGRTDGEGYALQKQPWDVVLREKDRERSAIERLLFYITENPVREGLARNAKEWEFSGAQAAGYPDMDWRSADFRERMWDVYEREVKRYGDGASGAVLR